MYIYIHIHVLRILHLSCIQSTSGCAITVPLPRYQDLAWEFLDCRPVRYGRKIAIFLAGQPSKRGKVTRVTQQKNRIDFRVEPIYQYNWLVVSTPQKLSVILHQ